MLRGSRREPAVRVAPGERPARWGCRQGQGKGPWPEPHMAGGASQRPAASPSVGP